MVWIPLAAKPPTNAEQCIHYQDGWAAVAVWSRQAVCAAAVRKRGTHLLTIDLLKLVLQLRVTEPWHTRRHTLQSKTPACQFVVLVGSGFNRYDAGVPRALCWAHSPA
jgi:hypothetical protein